MNSPAEFRASKIEELLSSGNQPASAPSGSMPQAAQSGPNCPQEECWLKVSSHELDEAESHRLIEHAAECQSCGSRLHYWASVLAEEETPEEALFFSQLTASKSGWQERMAKGLAEKSSPSRRTFFSRSFFLPTALGFAGALAAALVVILVMKSFHQQASPERLLAEAYTGQRIMDARIPLAAFAPVSPPHHQRAAGSSAMSDSVPLLEARAAITQALVKSPEDPHLLLLEARSDLLSEDYNTAIDTLKRIVAQNPANVEALSDLASAYSMRARATDTVSDQATALDYLEQAARLDPKNPVVLYNEAVALQGLYQYNNAIEVWKRFLAVEQDKRWIEDGKRRLGEAEAHAAQSKAQQSRLDPFLSSPEGMLHLARSPALLADYDEELSTIHLPLLLKTAFPQDPSAQTTPASPSSTNCSASCSAARSLLAALAASLKTHHDDAWLADFLRPSGNPGFAGGANLLANAVNGSLESDDALALREGEAAASYFGNAGNTAGRLRAEVERIHAFQRISDRRPCLTESVELEPALARNRYPWLAAEFWADESGCSMASYDLAHQKASLERSLSIAETARYRIAAMRVLGFLPTLDPVLGDSAQAWPQNIEGLRKFWAGSYPALRGYQFYLNLAYSESGTTRVYSAVLAHKEALSLISGLHQPATVAADRFLLVKAQVRAGEMQDAASQLKLAKAEFASLPSRETLRNMAADCHIMLAQAYLARSDAADAAAMLADAARLLDARSDQFLELAYSESMGRLALLQNDRPQAEARLTEAISIAEQGYDSLHAIHDRTEWIRQARDTYAALTVLRLREGASPIEALSIWERYRLLSSGLPLARWCRGAEIACLAQPLDAARKSLREETLLGSMRLDHSLLLWAMDDRGVRLEEVSIDPARFDLLNRTFSETVATPQSSETSILFYGRKLSETLLQPLSSSLDSSRTLVFDLDDSMEFLPVAALPLNSSYLGLQFSLSTVHSLLAASRTRRASPATPSSLVIGASLPGDPEAVPLPEAKTEALAVAKLLDHSRILTGGDATASSVRSAVQHSALIHFAGHTQSFGGQTRLVLARDPSSRNPQDAWLNAAALETASLENCRLVVLSACATGKREERDFDDTDDIVQSLAVAGVPDIVATHWDVDSAAAVPLMQSFYSGLALGLTTPQALARAEAALQSREYHHPFYWAAFYAVGLGRTKFRELIHE